jgi:hypothetical protein
MGSKAFGAREATNVEADSSMVYSIFFRSCHLLLCGLLSCGALNL